MKFELVVNPKTTTAHAEVPLHGRSTFEVVEVKFRRILKKSLSPFVVIAASIYFLIDALFFSVVKPLSRRLARLPIFTALASWIAARGPYVTLALFLVPLIILEPVKPVGIYLIASGHSRYGVLVLSVGDDSQIFLQILLLEVLLG